MLIKIWNSKTFELEEELRNMFNDVVSDVTFAWNETRKCWTAWASSYDKSICVWELKDTKSTPSPAVAAWNRGVLQRTFTEKKKTFLSGSL